MRAGLRRSGSRFRLHHARLSRGKTVCLGARKKRDVGRSGRAKCQSPQQQPPAIGAQPEGGRAWPTPPVLRATFAGPPAPRSARVVFFPSPVCRANSGFRGVGRKWLESAGSRGGRMSPLNREADSFEPAPQAVLTIVAVGYQLSRTPTFSSRWEPMPSASGPPMTLAGSAHHVRCWLPIRPSQGFSLLPHLQRQRD